MNETTPHTEDQQQAGCLTRPCSAEFTLDCIKSTLKSYDPETATHEEMVECWLRCSRAVVNHYKSVSQDEADMTAHIVAMEDADREMEQPNVQAQRRRE